MKPEIERAIREVLEDWETPDSPEALAASIYQLRRVYNAHRRQPGPSKRGKDLPKPPTRE